MMVDTDQHGLAQTSTDELKETQTEEMETETRTNTDTHRQRHKHVDIDINNRSRCQFEMTPLQHSQRGQTPETLRGCAHTLQHTFPPNPNTKAQKKALRVPKQKETRANLLNARLASASADHQACRLLGKHGCVSTA